MAPFMNMFVGVHKDKYIMAANSYGMQILPASNNVKMDQQKHVKYKIDNSFYQFPLPTKLLSTEIYSL